MVWPHCSLRKVRQLGCYEAFWTSRVLILLASCWHVRLVFLFFFFSLYPKEWKTLYLHRVMAVLLHLKLHHPPYEQFALLFKMGVGADHIWSFIDIWIDFHFFICASLFIWEEFRTLSNWFSLFLPMLALDSIGVTHVCICFLSYYVMQWHYVKSLQGIYFYLDFILAGHTVY